MKSQHLLDLLPAEIHARRQASIRTGRYIAFSAAGVLLVTAMTTHARLALSAAEQQLLVTEVRADHVLAIERKAQRLREERAELLTRINLYDRIALPLEMGRIVATVVNELPPGTTLESFTLNAGVAKPAKQARSRTRSEKSEVSAARTLVGELTGFSAADHDIAELVAALTERPPFASVGLDFSRTREIRGRPAREFRISFRIDLDAAYQVLALERDPSPSHLPAHAAEGELADAGP